MPHICYIYIIFRRLTRKRNGIEEKKIMSSTSSKSLVQYWVMCCLGYSISALEAGSMSLLAAAQCTIFWDTRRSFSNVTVKC